MEEVSQEFTNIDRALQDQTNMALVAENEQSLVVSKLSIYLEFDFDVI